jgi:hypothetical protein
MSYPTTPGVPSTPSSDEAAALTLLDARGHHAADSLRAAVDTLVTTRANGVHGTAGGVGSPTGSRPPAGGQAAATVELSPFAARSRPRPRRLWLVAAALIVLAGVVAALALRRDLGGDGTEGMVSDDVPSYLVPGWTPDGWHVQEAREVHTTDFSEGSTGTLTVYGDGRLEDPWLGPNLQVSRRPGGTLEAGESDEPIMIGGHQGLLVTLDERASMAMVRWMEGDDLVSVLGGNEGMGRSIVVPAAEALAAGDIGDGLPDGFEQLASGPINATVARNYVSSGTRAIDGFALGYGEAAPATGQLVVLQQAGDRDDVDLLQLHAAPDSNMFERIDVRGLPAYRLGDQWFQWNALAWYEPSARLVVTVLYREIDPSDALRFAEGLRASTPGEVDELEARADAGPFAGLAAGEVPIAEGAYADGAPWRLVAGDDGAGGFSLSFVDDTGTAGIASGGAQVRDDAIGPWGDIEVGVVDHGDPSAHGGVAVFGVVQIQAGEVIVEAPGREAIPLTRYEALRIPGWSHSIFWGVVPADLGPAEVVARSGPELEFARAPLDVTGG